MYCVSMKYRKMKKIFTIIISMFVFLQVVGQKDIVISGASIMSAAINNEGVAYVWGANKINGYIPQKFVFEVTG